MEQNFNMFILPRHLRNRCTRNRKNIFFKFYRRHHVLISKFNVGLKTLLREGLSEHEFYGDLVYKFKKLIGRNDLLYSLEKILYVTNVYDII